MGYDIRAFIAKAGTFDEIKLISHCITVVPLNQGFEMLMNDSWFYDFMYSKDDDTISEDYKEFFLTPKQIELGLRVSLQEPIACIEADFAGGNGEQRAVVWHLGKVVLLPETNGIFGGIPDSSGAINTALRFIGVQAQSPWDEFASSGIAKHRHIEDWFYTYNTSPNKEDCYSFMV